MLRTAMSEFFATIEESECYKILSNKKPDYLQENEWTDVVGKLSDLLENILVGEKPYRNYGVFSVKYEINDFIKILKLSKPQHFSENKWDEIRIKILKTMESIFRNNNYSSDKGIEELDIYKLLCANCPEYLSKDEWNDFSARLADVLKDIIIQKISRSYLSSDDMLYFLSVKKPQTFIESSWNELIELMYNKYVVLKKQEIIALYYDNEKLIKELNQEKPRDISLKYWDKCIDYIKKIYKVNVLYKMYSDKEPIEFLNNQPIKYLNESDTLKSQAYSIQLTNYYIESLNEEYTNFISSGKPDWIKETDYNIILQYLERSFELNTLINQNKDKSEALDEDRKKLLLESYQVNELREKITYQLEVLDAFLSDPTVLERIEEYNNVFAKGNFENLLKVASLLCNE